MRIDKAIGGELIALFHIVSKLRVFIVKRSLMLVLTGTLLTLAATPVVAGDNFCKDVCLKQYKREKSKLQNERLECSRECNDNTCRNACSKTAREAMTEASVEFQSCKTDCQRR